MRLNMMLMLDFITSLPFLDLFIHKGTMVLLSLKISISGPLLLNGINSRFPALGHNMDSLEGE